MATYAPALPMLIARQINIAMGILVFAN